MFLFPLWPSLFPSVSSLRQAGNADGSLLSVRKKLSFESEAEEVEEDAASSSKSWYQYSSSESDWLQSGGLELDGMSDDAVEPEDSNLIPPDRTQAELPEESARKGILISPLVLSTRLTVKIILASGTRKLHTRLTPIFKLCHEAEPEVGSPVDRKRKFRDWLPQQRERLIK